eukprot:TRINITY_DN9802_c0_g1_i3.p1 TRINITY_DN9802_c0_g1~~TRINITY_DN9802_c0_g1_i3.p1  ORF type:complete len:220 (-),score=45.55 TRINITY_DN9802_c0_g1_i3:61-720(-)
MSDSTEAAAAPAAADQTTVEQVADVLAETNIEDTPAVAEEGDAPAAGEEPAAEFSSLHQLQRAWTMWYDNPGGRSNPKNWFENIKRIITFSTVEEFWCTFNNIMPPSRLQNGSNYHLFTDSINPMWEDENNRHGGKWVVVFPKGRREVIDEYWLHILLALIGESFEDTDEICGAVASLRKSQSKIAVWTRHADDCLLYTSDAADEEDSVDLGGRRIIKK